MQAQVPTGTPWVGLMREVQQTKGPSEWWRLQLTLEWMPKLTALPDGCQAGVQAQYSPIFCLKTKTKTNHGILDICVKSLMFKIAEAKQNIPKGQMSHQVMNCVSQGSPENGPEGH